MSAKKMWKDLRGKITKMNPLSAMPPKDPTTTNGTTPYTPIRQSSKGGLSGFNRDYSTLEEDIQALNVGIFFHFQNLLKDE